MTSSVCGHDTVGDHEGRHRDAVITADSQFFPAR